MLPGTMGLLQSTEVLKLILGTGSEMVGQLLLYDALEVDFRKIHVPHETTCQLCGLNPTIKAWSDAGKVPVIKEVGSDKRENNADQVSAQWLREAIQNGKQIRLIDVRESHEWDICRLKGAEHHPVSKIQTESFSKDFGEIIVFYCHRGLRSQRTLRIFQELGHANCRSLIGGIDAWAEAIEPEMARY